MKIERIVFCHIIIVLLLCKRKNAAVNCHKLTHMLHHCMYVWYYVHMVHVKEVTNPLFCTLFKLVKLLMLTALQLALRTAYSILAIQSKDVKYVHILLDQSWGEEFQSLHCKTLSVSLD